MAVALKCSGEHYRGAAASAPLRVTKLDLSANRLADRAAVELAHALSAEASSLQVLNLNENGIGNEGGAALGRALPSSPGLRRLGLKSNPLGGGAGEALAAGLEGSSVLALSLENSAVPYSCVEAAERLVLANRKRWEEGRPQRSESRRRALETTSEELNRVRAQLAWERAELTATEAQLEEAAAQLYSLRGEIHSREEEDEARCAHPPPPHPFEPSLSCC